MECLRSSLILQTASIRMFGVSLADLDALDDLISFEELPALRRSNDFFYFNSDGELENGGLEGGESEPSQNEGDHHNSMQGGGGSLSYHQPQQVHYQNQEKRSRKREAQGDGANRRRCKNYRMAKNKTEQQEKEELQMLKDRKDSLEKLLKDLERRLGMTRDYYLKCILSGRISFSSE